MTEPGDSYLAARDRTRDEILRLYGLKPWQLGFGPVPRRVRLWARVVPRSWRAWWAERRD